MIKHYFASALIRFRKAPFAAGAHVLTLSLGLACFVAAYGIAAFLQAGDSHHPGAERLYYISMPQFGARTQSAWPMAAALREDAPELEAVGGIMRIGPIGDALSTQTAVSADGRKAFFTAVTADAEVFDLLAFDFIEGSAETALRAPDEVVLTQAAARTLFGSEPALGRAVTVDGRREGRVAGVVAPPRRASFLGLRNYEVLTHPGLANNDQRILDSWIPVRGETLVRLPESMTLQAFQARLDSLVERRVPRNSDGEQAYSFRAYPIGELMAGGDPLRAAALPLALGALILLVAGVNYANLAAAQAESRVKESGMRRALGADRAALIAQHAVEAGLLVLPALALAVLIVVMAAPVIGNLAPGMEPAAFLGQGPGGALFLACLAAATAVVISLYPALRTARVRAADALGPGPARAGAGLVVRALVGVQFFTVSFLIIVVTVVQLQIGHLRSKAFDGPDAPVVVLDEFQRSGIGFEALAARLREAPQVEAMTMTSWAPWAPAALTVSVGTSSAAGAPRAEGLTAYASEGYVATYGPELLAGRDFDQARDRQANPLPFMPRDDFGSVMIERRMAEALGFATPQAAVGAELFVFDSRQDGPGVPLGRVVGVIETDRTYHFRAPENDGVMLAFIPPTAAVGTPAVRLDPARAAEGLAAIQTVWDALAPDVPLRARFLDELFAEATAEFRTISRLFVLLSACALLISTTGLLGIAVFVAARRRREMGVRKTLGASTPRLARLLLADFARPVLVGNLLAWPAGYLVAVRLLEPFADRIALTPGTFLISTLLTMAVAAAAVAGEAWKTASVRPAEVLRQA